MQRQDTDNDPSSSSMSGYDLKGMLSRVRNQANYVQNNVLKSSHIDTTQSPQPGDFYGEQHQFMSQNVPSGD